MTRMQLPMTPARRAALAIGLPVCLALTGFAGLSFVARIGQGSFPVSYAIADSTGKVSVHLSAGDVRLGQAAGRPAELTGTARYSLVRPSFTERTTSDGLAFVYNCDNFVGDCGLDATVSVPAGTTASVSTGGGNATVTGTTGGITVWSGGGDVTANGVAGDISLHSDGGNLQGAEITAAHVNASTGGGDVKLVFTRVPRNVQVSTNGGNVTIVVPAGRTQYDLTTHTDGGTIDDSTIPIDTSSSNVITATSGGGDIIIQQGE